MPRAGTHRDELRQRIDDCVRIHRHEANDRMPHGRGRAHAMRRGHKQTCRHRSTHTSEMRPIESVIRGWDQLDIYAR